MRLVLASEAPPTSHRASYTFWHFLPQPQGSYDAFNSKYCTYLVGVSADSPRSDDVISYKHLERSVLADERQTKFVGDGQKTRALPGQIIGGVEHTDFLHLAELKILFENKTSIIWPYNHANLL